jgi:hypothetical protein
VVLSDTMDWTEMEARAEKVRANKLKNAAGRPPHLRVMLGVELTRFGGRFRYAAFFMECISSNSIGLL